MAGAVNLLYLQWGLLVFFLTPLVEVLLMALGWTWQKTRFRKAPGKFTKLIIQITTVGDEHQLVRQTVDTIKGYGLQMDYEIWVVIEPGRSVDYPNATRVIVVPKWFKARSIDKARALEYTRVRLRKRLDLNRRDVKILFVDDDTLPTKKYIETAFVGDYDLCQGVTIPNRYFAGVTFMHFILSHMDNIRTRNCLIYCSCTEGVTGKPLFVHGEGLCITGHVEDRVTWNWPIIASDDLVFGTNAAYMGYSWGYFHEYIQLVSPWSWRDNMRQRHRWTWGNLWAIGKREIMPLGAAIFKGSKYVFGLFSVFASTTGAILLFMGIAKVPPQAYKVFWAALAAWIFSYGLCGWINSGGESNRRRFQQRKNQPGVTNHRARSPCMASAMFWGFRVLQTLVAAVFCPIWAITPALVIIYSVFKGPPKKFVVIAKTHPASG